ncbi:MAG: hypothetical protein CR994_02625 [Maribacter sp.]|nr:MAG: hypothetical protein CR994_02625 [Maribacter sp.]
MGKRNYNVFFNTHTVSGIVISVGLFIIFFTGSFSFFKEEIGSWQKGEKVNHGPISEVDCDGIIRKLHQEHNLNGRDLDIYFEGNLDVVRISLGKTKDTINNPEGTAGAYYYLNLKDFTTKDYYENYNLGEFLYRLHFLDPFVYPIGRYLAGLIAIFFVFAIITGTIVHWKKILPDFYSFNPRSMLKKMWTDAHTALGIIGLPFQFMYGITGAFFIIGVLALLPASILFNNDQQKMMEEMRPRLKTYEWKAMTSEKPLSVNTLIERTEDLWSGFNVETISVSNFGGADMKYTIYGELDTKKRFIGVGRVAYDAYSGKAMYEKDPNELNYLEDFQVVWGRLHFADFGGITTRIIYFIFGILTCFVIITGVLVYIEARNKKSMTLKQRLYTARVGHIYLAICLSMLPVTALSFLFARITNGQFESPQNAFYWFYFVTWGIFVLFYYVKRDNYFTNKNTLLLGAIFGSSVPIVNGITSGNWFWNTFAEGQYGILSIDVLWTVIAAFSLLFYLTIRPGIKDKSTFAKNPIDYKALKAEEAKVSR